MPSPANFLPVYGADKELLYHAPLASVTRLIDAGRVRPVGTRHRVRALIAICGTEELLRAARPPLGQRFSHNHETPYNPRGVWTHSRNAAA